MSEGQDEQAGSGRQGAVGSQLFVQQGLSHMGDGKTWKEIAILWAAGQPFTNILLVAMLACIGWISWYTVTAAIPMHLKTIQEGYERIDKADRDDRKEIRTQYEMWLKQMVDINSQMRERRNSQVEQSERGF